MPFPVLSTLVLALAATSAAPRPSSMLVGNVLIPGASIELPEDPGVRMHTNHRIMLEPAKGLGPSGGMTPAQIQAFYGMPDKGGHDVIAIVDAYDYPTALNDFNVFSAQFGLAQEPGASATASSNQVFQVVYAGGARPAGNGAWNQEAAVDIEWAHAMAPGAKIVLVESNSESDADLFAAVDVAAAIAGVKQVSMSWAGSEFAGEAAYESHFDRSGPVFFGCTGDTGKTATYPACSQYIVAVGGTSVTTGSTGAWVSETAWSDGGGGSSSQLPRPAWQDYVSAIGSKRAIPDISAAADPETCGVAVYDSTAYQGKSGWMVVGGTSVSTPCMAGMVNVSGAAAASTTQFLTSLYENRLKTPYPFRDITTGSNGFAAGPGWDFATGLGTPRDGGTLSFLQNAGTATGMDVLNLVGNYGGTGDPILVVTGDSAVGPNDLDFLMMQLGW